MEQTTQWPASQKLPAGLAGVLNSPEDNRDSAYYSSTDASSKHTSAASGLGFGALSPISPNFHNVSADKTPSPTAASTLPQSLVSPLTGNMSVASMVSPSTPGRGEPRRFERRVSLGPAPHSATLTEAGDTSEALSRRESVDSRFNQGFNDMRLGNSSYSSHNQSATSIHTSLQQHRNTRPVLDSLSMHRISNGYQPNAERNPDGQAKTTRVAPAITGPAQSTIARAAEPTKGQAWAFPEEEISRLPSGATTQSLIDSRRSSIAESLASSQFTSEYRLPAGQRRLDDGLVGIDYQRLSSTSAEFPAVHHHSLQSKQVLDLQVDDGGSHCGAQPYSRTPELRISHKLAERKRRTEMKELFEQLRDLMPQERGSKASKWEILTKAIAEHQRQSETIRGMQSHISHQQHELEMLKRELHGLRADNERAQRSAQPGPDQFSEQYGRPRPELPPLRSLQGSSAPDCTSTDTMTGVQYEQPRMSNFRAAEPGRL